MGKQLVIDAMHGKKNERIPWVPFVGCHGASLIGEPADKYLKSGELMAKGALEAIKQYNPDGMPINFDLSIEAEALGCRLEWAEHNPPAVATHILAEKTLDQLPEIDVNSGRIKEVVKALGLVKAQNPDVALYALLAGPFTLSLHLKGTDIFMDMFDNPAHIHELMEYCTNIAIRIADIYIDAGCDVVSLVDPMTSQISPDTFREFVTPYVKRFFDHVRERQTLSSFFVCGHAQKNVEAMCETGPDNISVDENIPLDFVKTICDKYNVSFGGNLQLTVVLLMGNEDDVMRNTIECMDVGGDTGFILAPGCDLPFATPKGNLELVTQIVHDEYKQDVARKLLEQGVQVDQKLNLSDYGFGDKVVVDIVTLDSESCAPCQYMVEAVRDAAPHFGDIVVWREHKIKERESVEFMMGLMVRNVPTICIDGQIKFVSTIPSRDKLIEAIQERVNEKFALKIQQQRGKLLVLGADCDACKETWENAQTALRELGSNVELEYVNDEEKIAEYGITTTPAVLALDLQIKSTGRIPSVEVIKEWIKSLE